MGKGRARTMGLAVLGAVLLALFVTVVVPLASTTPSASAYQAELQCEAPNFVQQGPLCFVTTEGGLNDCSVTDGVPACPEPSAIYGRPPCRDGYVEIVASNVCWPEPNTTPVPIGGQDPPDPAPAGCAAPNFVASGGNCFVTDPVGVDAGCSVTNGVPTCPSNAPFGRPPCRDGFVEIVASNVCWPEAGTCGYASAIVGDCGQPTEPEPDCTYSQAIVGCPLPVEDCGYSLAIIGQCPEITPPVQPSPTAPEPLFTVSSGPLTIATESSVAFVWQPTTVSMTGCPGGTATYAVLDSQGVVATSGQLPEDPTGTYSSSFDGLPGSGDYTIQTAITCPNSTVETESVGITYYDPSGQVRDCVGAPIVGATVTLTRADTASGPFTTVPNGSTLMSPTNRLNPMPTDSNGLYGWDVADGFYVVVVDAGEYGIQQTEPLQVPPPRFNVNFDFACQPDRVILEDSGADQPIGRLIPPLAQSNESPTTPAQPTSVGTVSGTTTSPTNTPIAVTGNNDDIWMVGTVLFAMGVATTGAARRRRQLTS